MTTLNTVLSLNDFENYRQLASDFAWAKEQRLFEKLKDEFKGDEDDFDEADYMDEVQDKVRVCCQEYFKDSVKPLLIERDYTEEQIEAIEHFFN